MCGRYSFDAEIDALNTAWKLASADGDYAPNTDVRPTQTAPALLADGRIRLLRWGFSPPYRKQILINARGETAAEKPTFREAFRRRRCILPATGFYEWKAAAGGKKEKHHFTTGEPFLAMAGLWEIFSINRQEIPCFTIITTAATEQMDGIHDRMPVLLTPAERTEYLNHTALTAKRWDEILLQRKIRLTHEARP